MRRGHTRGLLALGLIGVGPSWERRYRPAVRRLSERLCIRVVHDPVLSRAQAVAQETGADVADGLMQVIDHPGLNGVLVLDSGWYGLAPAEFACERQKPLFLGGNWLDPPAHWQRLAESAQHRGVMLVPELPLRFQPATTRLRELIASRLGPVRGVQVRIHTAPHAEAASLKEALAAAVDWCSYVTRRSVDALTVVTSNGVIAERRWALTFRPDARGIGLTPAEIGVMELPHLGAESRDSSLHAVVECEQGQAVLENATTIRWSMSNSAESAECLAQERPDVEVMLDQFCRRLVGGLIPTATLSDVAVALGQVEQLEA